MDAQTALEVRGTRIKGSVTIVQVDARCGLGGSDLDFETAEAAAAFRSVDVDDSGEIDHAEVRRAAEEQRGPFAPCCTLLLPCSNNRSLVV